MDVFQLFAGDGPLVAAAIHSGHGVRAGVARHLALGAMERLREEDPFTDELAKLAPTWVIGRRSRFEVDLNRPPAKAVYLEPDDAWGLTVWRGRLPDAEVAESAANYELFYATTKAFLAQLVARHGRIVVLDLHSYNHRRDGPAGLAAKAATSPEVNVGTGSMDREAWGPVVDRFMADLRAYEVNGHRLDVRENVRFRGGHFPTWIHETFPGQACAIAVEFKKTFMDEWTGELDRQRFGELQRALESTFPGILAAMRDVKSSV
jgi:N-formylglutamate amidohydrolase